MNTDVRSNTRETPIVRIYDSMQTDCFSEWMPITSKKRRIWQMPDPRSHFIAPLVLWNTIPHSVLCYQRQFEALLMNKFFNLKTLPHSYRQHHHCHYSTHGKTKTSRTWIQSTHLIFLKQSIKNKDLILFRDLVSYVWFALVIMIYRK